MKSVKQYITIVTRGQILKENELRTFLTQIEAILNSRRLAYSGRGELSQEVLTPGNFLIGRNLTSLPKPTESGSIELSERYEANQQRIRFF